MLGSWQGHAPSGSALGLEWGGVADNTRFNVSCLCKFMIPGLTTYYVTTYYLLGLGLGLGLGVAREG